MVELKGDDEISIDFHTPKIIESVEQMRGSVEAFDAISSGKETLDHQVAELIQVLVSVFKIKLEARHVPSGKLGEIKKQEIQ